VRLRHRHQGSVPGRSAPPTLGDSGEGHLTVGGQVTAHGAGRPPRAAAALPAKAVAAIARERLLRALVGRFLPRPWSWLVRIVANLALLPTAVLRDAGTVVAGVVPGMNPSPAPAPTAGRTPAAGAPAPTAPVPTVGPAEAPAAPTTPPVPLFTVEVPEPTWDSDLLEQTGGLEPTQLRYPAPKRSVAKKRR